MAIKKRQNFEVKSGDHKDVIFTVTDSTGASVDLTGASVTWVIANQFGGASILRLNTDSGSGITVSGCTYTVALSPVHTSDLAGLYYHESQVRTTASDIITVATGAVKVEADIFTG